MQTAEGRESKPGVRKVQMGMMRREWMEERDRNKRLGTSPQIAATFSHQRFFRRAREKLPLGLVPGLGFVRSDETRIGGGG